MKLSDSYVQAPRKHASRRPSQNLKRGYPKNLIDGTLSEVKFSGRQSKLRKQTKETHEGTIPFVTTYHPAGKNLKQLLMQQWRLIHNQPMHAEKHFLTPPIISYRRGKSLKDILVRGKTLQAHMTASQLQRHVGK